MPRYLSTIFLDNLVDNFRGMSALRGVAWDRTREFLLPIYWAFCFLWRLKRSLAERREWLLIVE